MEEQAIIRKAMLGDARAMETLIRRYYSDIHAFCCRQCGNAATGADLCQETFLRLVQHLPAYREQGFFKSWLFKIAANVCKDAFRKKHPDLELNEELEKPAEPWFEEHMENAQLLKAAMGKLSDNRRTVILLRYYHDFSLKEIARITGTPVPTVKTRLHRGVRELRAILGEEMLLEI